jgi:YggT family protein
MGVAANLTLQFGGLPLGDAVSSVETFVNVFIVLYSIVLIAYILMSWVRLPYSVALDRIQRFLYDVSEPYLRIFRRILPMAGGFDFSPLIALLALGAINRLVIVILDHFH